MSSSPERQSASPDQSRRADAAPGVMRVPASLSAIGLGGVNRAVLEDRIATLPFEAAMQVLAPVAAALHHHRDEQAAQLHLAGRLIGDNELYRQLRAWVQDSADRLVFDERHITALQRLLVERAHDDRDARTHLSDRERATLVFCLLAIGDALVEPDPPSPGPGDDFDIDAWSAFTVQTGCYHADTYIIEAIARTYTMLVEFPSEDEIHELKYFCPLDEWACEDGDGLGLADQLAFGFALAVRARAHERHLELEERHGTVRPGILRSLASAEHEAAAFSVLSADRDEFRAAFAAPHTGPLGWDHTAFERHPFLRRRDGSLLLVSPRALTSWLSRGLYFRMLDAARRRPHPTRADQTCAQPYMTFVGTLAERYVFRLVQRSHETVPAAVVSSDREYRVGKRRLRSPDVAVAAPPNLVLMEVYSGRVPLPARTRSDVDSVVIALEKMVLCKLTELQARVSDVLDGHVRLPGTGDHVTRIHPVLVLAGEGVLQTQILRAWIDVRLPDGAFGDSRVAPPTICDLDDLDPLLALVERGHTLAGLLDAIHSSPYADLPPRNWVSAIAQSAADDRPRYVKAQFKQAMRSVHARLFPTSGRFDELWAGHV